MKFLTHTFFSIRIGVVVAGLSTLHSAKAQDTLRFWEPAPQYLKARGITLATGLGVTYAASMTGLYYLWYADYELGSFHGFNDSDEWLQVDKVGHVGSAYYLGKWGIDLMKWTGMPTKKAAWMGGGMGLVFLTTVEVFDGFSEQWGFSGSDMIANLAGSAMAVSQELAWREQRVKIKFSYHDTEFNEYNEALLGEKFPSTMFKDYNGQTYWLSVNIRSFFKSSTRIPSWLNIAAGYGAEEMTGAVNNEKSDVVPGGPDYKRYRQFYIAPDIDLTRIKTGSGLLKSIFGVIGFIKIPSPTLEFGKGSKPKFHWLYF